MDVNNYDIIADLYDTYVPVTFDIDFFIEETHHTQGDVLELMSGTGRVSIPLLEAGVNLTCVDNSRKSNEILRHKLQQKGLKAPVFDMDICQLELHRQFSMVIIPFASFAHLVLPAQQLQALQRIFQHLLPGGTFILTLSNPQLRAMAVDGQMRLAYTYPLPGNETLLLWIVERFDPADRQVVQAFEFFEQYNSQGLLDFKRLMELHFRLSSQQEIEQLLKASGFLIKEVYGDYDLHTYDAQHSPYLIWKLEKPAI